MNLTTMSGATVAVSNDYPYYWDRDQRRRARELDKQHKDRQRALPKKHLRQSQKHGPVSHIDVRGMNLTRDYMKLVDE